MGVRAVLGRRGLVLGLAAALLMVVVEGIEAQRINRRVAASAEWQSRAYRVSTAVGELMSAIHAAQSHERGYLITGQEAALVPYRRYMGLAWERLEELRALSFGEPGQPRRVAELQRLLKEHQAGLERTIDLRRQQELGQVATLVSTGQILRLAALQEVAATITSAEQRVLAEQEQELRQNVESAATQSVARSVGSVTIVVLVFVLLLRGVRRQRRLSKELQQQANLLQSIVNSQADGLIVAGLDGGITHFNAAAERILGMKAGGMEVTSWLSADFVFHPDGRRMPGAEFPLARALAGHSSDDVDLLLRPPWATEGLHLSVSARPLLDPDGRVTGGVAVVRDVSERNRTAEAMRLAKESAEQASVLKGQFVANMSHELRTPLNGVVGMLDLLSQTPLDDEQRGFVRTARLAADALLANVNEVLDFSKLEARKLQVESIPFSPRQCLEDSLAAHALAAHRKHLELTSEVGPGVPDWARGDPHRLRQVLENLVSNAIKFTDRGEVVVRAESERMEAGQLRLMVSVSDTGIGIPAEKQPQIFDPFHQADGSTTRRFGGTGLGLTIAAQLVHLMGGRMWIESQAGHGSTFHFTVTLVEQSEGEAQQRTAAAAGSSRLDGMEWQGLRALVVDDNETSRRTVCGMLQGWGFSVTAVADGESALAAAQPSSGEARGFSLFVVDSEMPEMDGLELCRRLSSGSSSSAEARGPIVMLSSSTAAGEQARCLEAGARVCVTKPVRQSDLLSAVVTALPSSVLAAPAAARTVAASPTPYTGRKLEILLVEDNEFNQAVALQTLRRWGHEVDLAKSGREALEMTGRRAYDIVLMDVQMPEMDGLQATAAIRARERSVPGGRRQPILAMTARAMEGDEAACRAAGMDGYLAKPLRLASLAAELERVVGTGAEREPPLDARALLEEAGDDRDLLMRMIAIYREEAPVVEARLAEAVMQGRAEEINQAAHALKSMIGHWRQGRAYQAAARLEALGRRGDVAASGAVYDELRREMGALEVELQGLSSLTERERVMA